jgi:nucleoside phosphorylase
MLTMPLVSGLGVSAAAVLLTDATASPQVRTVTITPTAAACQAFETITDLASITIF